MPAKSKAQNRMMQARCRGRSKGKGPSKETACEYVRKTKGTKSLPKRKGKK